MSLLAALLLVLQALFLASPAAAVEDLDNPCDQYGYTKINTASGSADLEWGSIAWGGEGGTAANELAYDIDAGYAVEFCLKAGNGDNTFSGARTGSGSVFHDNPDLSHIGYRLVDVCPEDSDNPGAPYENLEEDCYDDEQTCPEDSDNPGAPYENLEEDCYDDEQVCPEGTDNAGQVYEDIADCDDPEETEVCPDGTTNEGLPIDEVEACDVPDETEVEPDVVAPTAAVGASCDGVTANLDNTESDTAVTFTVVINGNEQTITVPAGASDSVEAALGNGDSWSAVVAAGDTVLAEGGDTEDCTVEVLPNVVEKPQPAPAVAPAAQELPATGLGSTELLLLSLLLIGLGGTMLLAPQARREA